MRTKHLLILLVSVLLMPGATSAASDVIKNEAQLSYIDASGNTETTTFNAKNTLDWTLNEKTNLIWMVKGLYGESNDVKTAEQYTTELRGDYKLSKTVYMSLIAGWLQDEFAGIDDKYYVGPAVGYIFLNGPKHFVKSELAVDYVREDYIDDTSEEFAQGSLFGIYEYAISDKNKFFQTLKYSMDLEEEEKYLAQSVIALVYGFSDTISLKTAYEVNYVNKPIPSTLDRTDKIFSTTLIVNY